MPRRINYYSNFNLQLQEDIIEVLSWKSLDTNHIAARLKRPYHTVRATLRTMIQEGQIVPVGYEARNTQYRLANPEVAHSRIMPFIFISNVRHKFIWLLNARFDKTRATQASENIPLHVVRLLHIAQLLHEGNAAAGLQLKSVKHDLEIDLLALRNCVELYRQILDSPKLWDTETLRQLPKDTDWDQDAIDGAWDYYLNQRGSSSE